MALSPEKLAAMVANAKAAAAIPVEDPTAPAKPEGPALDRNPLQPAPAPVTPLPVQQAFSTTPPKTELTPAEVEYPGLFELQEKILTLDKAIQGNHPDFDRLLETIHRNLDKDAQLLHLLKPEDIATIFRGLKKKTQTVIVAESVASASSGRARGLKNIGLEDL